MITYSFWDYKVRYGRLEPVKDRNQHWIPWGTNFSKLICFRINRSYFRKMFFLNAGCNRRPFSYLIPEMSTHLDTLVSIVYHVRYAHACYLGCAMGLWKSLQSPWNDWVNPIGVNYNIRYRSDAVRQLVYVVLCSVLAGRFILTLQGYLTLCVLNFSEGTKTYIYIICHSSTLTWHAG